MKLNTPFRRLALQLGVVATLGALASAQQCFDLSYGVTTFALGGRAYGIAVGDLDGDQDADFATTNEWDNTVHVSLNGGAGTFTGGWSATVSDYPSQIALRDLDADGDLDLVVGCYYALELFFNDGAGGFTNSLHTTLPLSPGDLQPIELAFDDLDADGDPDLLVGLEYTGFTGGIRAALNDGAGGFTWGSASAVDIAGSAAVFSDFNGDSVLDYAVAGLQLGTIRVHMGLGAGLFAPSSATLSIGLYGSSVTAGDFDGDGDIDLIGGAKYSLSLFLNQGGGNFGPAGNIPISSYSKALVPGDLDGDGDLDLVATFGSGHMQLLMNSGAAAFTSYFWTTTPIQTYATALIDVDGDGMLDVLAGDIDSGVKKLVRAQCGMSSYCVAKLNSLGCSPAMTFAGAASASSAAPFDVGAVQLLNNRSGLLVYGLQSQAFPFQGGTLCVGGVPRRTPVQNSAGAPSGTSCSGVFRFDFNARIQSGLDPSLLAGARVSAQYWSRDSADPAGFGTSLSNALNFTIAP